MDQIQNIHGYISEKIRAHLIKSFQDYEPDESIQEAQVNLLDSNWKDCTQAIYDYNSSIEFYKRLDMVQAEINRLDSLSDMGASSRRTPRFFDNQRKSIASVNIVNKREFYKNLVEIEQEYQRMIEAQMDLLGKKKAKLALDEKTQDSD